MKISVITPVYNGESTIHSCIESVITQNYPNKEHIIVDGGSSDKTVTVIKAFNQPLIKWISEKDKGLYDAFNKGIMMATGDVICFLCADDMYYHEFVLKNVLKTFSEHPEVDMVYGDIIYVDRNNLSKINRYWKSSPFKPGLFKTGWLPPNTALFIKRNIFLTHGLFNIGYKMSADFEMQYRFFEIHRVPSYYSSDIMVRMRSGGMSNDSFSGMYKSLKECYMALKNNNVRFPLFYIINTLFYRLKQTFIPSKIKKNLTPASH
jgi:glycosyltransferase involved in cell wall biosynthesis